MLVQEAHLRARLESGLKELGLAVSPNAEELLIGYLEQLHKWNKAFNLSGIRDPETMVSHHLLDSLSVLPFIDAERVADVGTGAGLPGIPLAICRPQTQFILIDSNSKKTRFIFQTAALLGLKNVEVVHTRVEDYAPDPAVDIVTSRAFASLADFIQACRHLLRDDPLARLLAMKGRMPDEELTQIPQGYHLHASYGLTVPGLEAERCVLDLRPRPTAA